MLRFINITDINECDEIPCHQICSNTPGSYQCSCHNGYTLDGIFCTGKCMCMCGYKASYIASISIVVLSICLIWEVTG